MKVPDDIGRQSHEPFLNLPHCAQVCFVPTAFPTMTSTCPWGAPSSVAAKPQPSMQDLMDEALALSLYEEEVTALQREINPEYQSSVFANLERNKERREQDRSKELLNADSVDLVAAASGESGAVPAVLTRTPAAAAGAAALARARVTGSLSMEDAAHGAGSGKGFTSLRESQRRQQKSEKKGFGAGRVEAEAHATTDGVMDERTTLILQKMINRGELDEVHGCVQSGKEAHVYFAVGTDQVTTRPVQLAVKIFRTTLNEFGNRHEYVTGDRRFDLNFQKKDQRRQIKAWTDKEYRNLCRAAKCHIRAPSPIVCKEHVLVMQFVGADGWPEPTLKNVQADLSPKQQARAYADVLQATRALYQRVHLVHGDLSEYNILFALREKRIWLIDFGQAVDRSHPDTDKLLRRDLHTINRFFQRGDLLEATADEVGLLSDENAYEYVVSETPKDVVAEFQVLAALLEELTDVPEDEEEEEEEEENVEQQETGMEAQKEDTVLVKADAIHGSETQTIPESQDSQVAESEKSHELSKSEYDAL
ncbi:Serine/threonine-protein kinase RIO3 [Phytophthora pseudosyringae]|uniref:non-specific serine/threonine protein kinase n=1 Tax=Phytophthora pseudosyringae TaxID=221518 RepID=A0A8T1VKL0_9STRA|nr:Serine/threonine-protein kinase RIO3 [Phytophthora pseudosyringae]